MGLDVYFRRDIANALQAIAVANTDTGPGREAFLRALVAVGCAFGLEVQPVDGRGAMTLEDAQRVIPQWTERKEH